MKLFYHKLFRFTMKLFITLIFAFFVAVNAQDPGSEEGTNQVSFTVKRIQ